MALPPTPAPDMGAPPPAPGADAPMADAGGWQVAFTIMRGPEGQFALVTGDEPMEDEGGEPAGPKFDDGPGLMRALMTQLEGGDGDMMKKNFSEGYEGGSAANGTRPMMDVPRGG